MTAKNINSIKHIMSDNKADHKNILKHLKHINSKYLASVGVAGMAGVQLLKYLKQKQHAYSAPRYENKILNYLSTIKKYTNKDILCYRNHIQDEKEQFIDDNKLQIHYDHSLNNEKMKKVIEKLAFLTQKEYIPTPFLKNFHLQSVYQIANSRNDKIRYYREIYTFQDGGIASLDWVQPAKKVPKDKNAKNRIPSDNEEDDYEFEEVEGENDTKILFVLHGLTGGSNMNYVKYLCQVAQKQGYRCVAYNSRGINTQLSTPMPFSGNKIDDLDIILKYIRKKYPNAPIFGVGTSFGGNMLLRWTGDKQFNSQNDVLQGLIGLAVPFQVQACIDTMGPFYEKFFVNRYKANVIYPHQDMLRNLEKSHGIDLEEVNKATTLREFHESISLKLFGYNTVEEYFRDSDVRNEHVENINIPLLLMQSLDDPIVSSHQIPKKIIYQNSNILYVTTKHGAHCCWFEGVKPKRWYPTPTLQFSEAILSLRNSQDK